MKSDFINCKNCTDDCHCKGKNITPICLSFKPAKITKADRFRAMSDEDLARNLRGCPDSVEVCPNIPCADCWLGWLRQEAPP